MLAALLIFSVALVPLIQVQINAQKSVIQLEEIEIISEMETFGLQRAKLINFGKTPEGRIKLLGGEMTWSAEIADPALTITEATQEGIRTIDLFRVELVLRHGDQIVARRYLNQIGWSDYQ